MFNIEIVEKDNLKILGLLVRYKRVLLGFSLRDLGEITNISHTLISNFERGLMIPNKDTIKDIFIVLKLDFYDNQEMTSEFNRLYKKIFKHLVYYEYEEAGVLIIEIEKNKGIYNNSAVVVNFTIIRLLFYVLTNTKTDELQRIMKEFEVVIDFFSDNQKQLFYFIQGLEYLNKEFYKESRQFFEKALEIGDHKVDLLINEHYVISLSKSNKFVDSREIANKCILEYESKTNYVRAMRLRTRIAHDFIRIHKFEEAKEIYNFVNDYSIKYKIKDLENRCNTRLAQIAVIQNKYELANEYLKKVTPEFSKMYHYLMFDLFVYYKDNKKLLEYYKSTMSKDWVKKHKKSYNFFKLIIMRNIDGYMDKAEYERLLLNQIDIAIKSDDAEMLEVSSKHLMNFYKSERKYKKGLEISEHLLHYLKNGV